jgi:hypothetical protein
MQLFACMGYLPVKRWRPRQFVMIPEFEYFIPQKDPKFVAGPSKSSILSMAGCLQQRYDYHFILFIYKPDKF